MSQLAPSIFCLLASVDVLDILYLNDIKLEGPQCLTSLVHYLSQKRGKLINVVICGDVQNPLFLKYTFTFIQHLARPGSSPTLLLQATVPCSFFDVNSLVIHIVHILSDTFLALVTAVEDGVVSDELS